MVGGDIRKKKVKLAFALTVAHLSHLTQASAGETLILNTNFKKGYG